MKEQNLDKGGDTITKSWISRQNLTPGMLYKTASGVKKLLGVAVDQHGTARLAFSDITKYNA